jgi:hypothetical protein
MTTYGRNYININLKSAVLIPPYAPNGLIHVVTIHFAIQIHALLVTQTGRIPIIAVGPTLFAATRLGERTMIISKKSQKNCYAQRGTKKKNQLFHPNYLYSKKLGSLEFSLY